MRILVSAVESVMIDMLGDTTLDRASVVSGCAAVCHEVGIVLETICFLNCLGQSLR